MMTHIAGPASGGPNLRLNLERLREARQRLQQQPATQTTVFDETVSYAPASSSTEKQDGGEASGAPHLNSSSRTLPEVVPARIPLTAEQIHHEAGQALQARSSQRVERVSVFRAPGLSPRADSSPASLAGLEPPLPKEGKYGLPLQDIQTVAQQSGFIGISQESIERAYKQRQSLLIDYRV
jgi:hypothetical protein